MAAPTHAKRIYYGRWNESTRIYEVDGQRLPSVTSVINMMDKPALVNWAARLSAEFAVDHREALADLPESAAIDAIKGGWRRSRDKAANFGTAVHEAIETGDTPDNEKLIPYVNAALDYLEEVNLHDQVQEVTVVSREYGYAGTMDLLGYQEDGNGLVVDWKSGKGLYDSAALQLAALMNCDSMIHEDGSLLPWEGTPMAEAVRLKADGGYQAETINRDDALGMRTYEAFLGLIPVWHYKTKDEVWA